MSLTPARIRGKRKLPVDPAPNGPKRRPGRPPSKPLPPPPPGLPPKLWRSRQPSKWNTKLPWPESYRVSQTQSASTETPPKKKRRKSYGRKLAPLERMPAEVLQEIFLESMNMDLPVASLELLHKLNSDHIKMEFAFRALFPNRADWMPEEEVLELQNQLLARRFFDWHFYKRYAAKACKALAAWPWLEEQDPDLPLDEILRRDPTFDALDRFNFAIAIRGDIPPFLLFREQAFIPERLLRGPWTSEKHMFLRFLFVQNLGIDHESSTSPETLIEELMSLARNSSYIDVAQWLICIAITSKVPLPQKLLRRAVIDGACDQEFVGDLLTWSLRRGIEYFDPMLWNWAERNGEKGRWLMDQLRASASKREEWAAVETHAP